MLDWSLISRLCEIHCTKKEICHIVDCDQNTLDAACERDNNITFSTFYLKYSAGGKMSLRRAQFNKALSGNATMQIWLGKQWLDQYDKTDSDPDEDANTFTLNYRE